MWKSIVAIALGAALGALLRWQLGARLNSIFPTIPPGTLAANLIGGKEGDWAYANLGVFFALVLSFGFTWFARAERIRRQELE